MTLSETIALSYLLGIASKKLYRFMEYTGEDLIQRLMESSLTIKEEGESIPIGKTHIEQAFAYAQKVIERSQAEEIQFLLYGDEAYPEILRRTTNERGDLTPPVLLYAKGDLSVAKEPCIAIAGTRHPSQEGVAASKQLAEAFVKEGLAVVSGLALGCDTAAHEGALAAKGKTVAFLAHGLHMVTPTENIGLAKRIVENGGLLLSEYPVGMSFSKYSFISRDRLQAGLSRATVVVQTDKNGGSMHVANATLMSQKPLYSVYFQDERTRALEISQGNDYLVKKGAKYLSVTDDLHAVAQSILNKPSFPTTLF